MRTLLVNGQIYSLTENFATAILVEMDRIAWIGSEAGAQVHLAEADEVIDLNDELVTPGFVNVGSDQLYPMYGFVAASRSAVPVAHGWTDDQWRAHGDRPVAVVPEDPCRLRSRIRAGLPTALVPADPSASGWLTLRAAVYGVADEERLTARGAFSALTRGAWRLLGEPDRGVLAVGAQATFVQWATSELVVESPDVRISNWSTDPRAATPGLPSLHPGHPLPTVTRVWVDGVPQ